MECSTCDTQASPEWWTDGTGIYCTGCAAKGDQLDGADGTTDRTTYELIGK